MIELGPNEVLRVTPEGKFIWAENADEMIETGDYSAAPAMPHILRALRLNAELVEALRCADAMLSGANMDAKAVERKVSAALAKAGESK